ncbi:hypothetical protein LEN26_008009 [Aphanomyces euteiches]|nr:hypothetical protein AeMF1_009646 [Aphanomyces euteiches]KAH9130985.1 hypothetical protein LEN26_008009 [Aphanomyces euteiches]KAH9197796.1 hypothetical protein AeNC1_000240 [Aphanomyces euteiches]
MNLVAIFGTAAAAYYVSPFMKGPWMFINTWDDSINFVENTMIQTPLSFASILDMLTVVKINVYEPLAWLLKAIVHSLAGMDSYTVRVVALSLHACNSALVYLTSLTVLNHLGTPDSTGCLLGTLLYAVHPIHVEVIGWPSAQPYALSMLFALLCLLSYLRALSSSSKMQASLFMASSTVFYIFSVLSKSVSILFPVAIFLIDVLLADKAPKLAKFHVAKLGFVVAGVLLMAKTIAANTEGTYHDADVVHLTFSQRCVKAFIVLLWPWRQFLWPAQLRYHYQVSPEDLQVFHPRSLLSIAFVAAITVGGLLRRDKAIVAAWIYSVAMLLPVSGLIPHGLVFLAADRYAYFPTLVFVPLCGAAFSTVTEPSTRRFVALLGCVWALCLAHVSVLQFESWRTAEALYRHGLHQDPTDWAMLDSLQDQLLRMGQFDEAKTYLERALRYSPTEGLKARLQIAKYLMLLQRVDDACAIYHGLLEANPSSAHVNNNVGICHWKMGKLTVARQHFVQALNGSGLTWGDKSPETNIELLDAWDPRTPIQASFMW